MLERVSASQVEAYKRCPRVWYNQSILKLRTPSTPAQERGTRVHTVVETYLKTGSFERPPPAADADGGVDAFDEFEADQFAEAVAIVKPAVEFLPDAFADRLVEHEIWLPTFEGGPKWLGYIDLIVMDPHAEIHDLKTISDLRYAKTPEELLSNTQMMSYARWILTESQWQEQDAVSISHLYMRTKKPYKAFKVTATATRARVEDVWARDLAVVREMQAWANEKPETADPLPPNTASCGMYGGCAYRKLCGLDSLKPDGNLTGSFAAKPIQLRGQKMSNGNGTTTSAPKSLAERLAEKMKAASGTAPAAATSVKASPPPPAVAAPLATGIVPPDAPARDEKPPAEVAVAAPAAPVVETPAAKKRGRSAKEAAVVAAVQTPAVVTPPAARTTKRPPNGFELWIDVACTKGPVAALAEDFIAPIVEAVSEAHGVADPRLLPYGAGKVAVATMLREHLDECPPILMISSMSPYAHEIIDTLTPYAARVFRKLSG